MFQSQSFTWSCPVFPTQLSFSIVQSCLFCCRLVNHRCMGSFLGSLFCFINLCACFCASTRLFWLLWFCSTFWILGAWYFQICSSSGLFWQFGGVLWFYMNVWVLYSSSVKNDMVILIGIAFNLQITLGSMTQSSNFNNINSFSSRAQDILPLFPSSSISFITVSVFRAEVFHL